MNVIKRVLWKIRYYMRPVEYARKIGVKIGEENSFVDHPDFGTEPYLVLIGNHNRISCKCLFLTHDGGRWVLDYLYPEDRPFLKFGMIEIGNNNFIGAKTIINPGVKVGDNCVIAAGSIVTKDIPSNEVWGGIPAKYIMSIKEYRDKLVNNKNMFDIKEYRTNKKNELERVFNRENSRNNIKYN